MTNPRAFRWAASALYAYTFIFVLLSIDLLVRIWNWRDRFDRSTDPLTIAFFEISRSAVVAAAILLGLWLTWRRYQEPALRALAIMIAFATIAFAKVAAFSIFPGDVQQRVAAWLLDHGAPRAVLNFVFGHPGWAAWLALAALLRFASCFPKPVTADAIDRSGRADRKGMLRGTLAGADVGASFRALATALVRNALLSPRRLAVAAVALALLHYFTRSTASHVIAGLIMAVAFGVAVTLLRAGYTEGDAITRRTLDWLTAGALLAAILFALSAAANLAPGPLGFLGVVLLAAAPVPALLGLAIGLTRPMAADPLRRLR